MPEKDQGLTFVIVDYEGMNKNYLRWFSNCGSWWTHQGEKAHKFCCLQEANSVARSLGFLSSGELSVQILKEVY